MSFYTVSFNPEDMANHQDCGRAPSLVIEAESETHAAFLAGAISMSVDAMDFVENALTRPVNVTEITREDAVEVNKNEVIFANCEGCGLMEPFFLGDLAGESV